MVKEIGHFIGGKHVKGTSGRFADVYDPNTGEVQAKVALATKAELRAAVENAKAASVSTTWFNKLLAAFQMHLMKTSWMCRLWPATPRHSFC